MVRAHSNRGMINPVLLNHLGSDLRSSVGVQRILRGFLINISAGRTPVVILGRRQNQQLHIELPSCCQYVIGAIMVHIERLLTAVTRRDRTRDRRRNGHDSGDNQVCCSGVGEYPTAVVFISFDRHTVLTHV